MRIGLQLLNEAGELIDRDYARFDLPAALEPGSRCEMTLTVRTPSATGRYKLKLDLVREGRSWFELSGSTPLIHEIEIE